MIKVPFRERLFHMVCGITCMTGLEKIAMANMTIYEWLKFQYDNFYSGQHIGTISGIGIFALAFLVSHAGRYYKE